MVVNRAKYELGLALIAGLVTLIVTILWVLLVAHHPDSSKPASRSASTPRPLTAGGQPVPAAWQTKARSLGYYCPSWNVKPGQLPSDVCMPLDK
ncbi:MAG TPA: hypothetical protein VFP32_02315 [Candidatus Saccharimonadales bacterium]|nr:hypothetical protein [Candidatus Saccharimonadales bacterium]